MKPIDIFKEIATHLFGISRLIVVRGMRLLDLRGSVINERAFVTSGGNFGLRRELVERGEPGRYPTLIGWAHSTAMVANLVATVARFLALRQVFGASG